MPLIAADPPSSIIMDLSCNIKELHEMEVLSAMNVHMQAWYANAVHNKFVTDRT